MSQRKSKGWYSNNCLHFLKCTLPLQSFLQTTNVHSQETETPHQGKSKRVLAQVFVWFALAILWQCYKAFYGRNYVARGVTQSDRRGIRGVMTAIKNWPQLTARSFVATKSLSSQSAPLGSAPSLTSKYKTSLKDLTRTEALAYFVGR